MRIRMTAVRGMGACALAAVLALASPLQALACTQVYVGAGQTTTGDTYVGRSEDYAPRHAKAFGVSEPRVNPTYTSEESDFNRTFTGTTYRYTYVRDLASDWDGHPYAYSEAGTNEKGVSVSATLSTGYNDGIAKLDPLCNPDNPNGKTTGIGEFNITDVVLGEADSARRGCEILGGIIDQYGANECNQVIIADASETWVFQMLSGHQWLALKMGPNDVSVNPNMGNLQFKVNLDDTATCLHSADVVKLPQDAGLLKTFDDGTPNIAATYGEADSGAGQNTRYAQGRAYFGAPLSEGSDYAVNDKGQVASIANPQLTFAPSKKIDTFTALRSLAARGEQVDSLNANLNPNLYAIGNNRTVENHIFQIRDGLTPDIATVQWEALSRAEFSLFLPSYSAVLTEVDQSYYPSSIELPDAHQGDQGKDSVDAALQAEPEHVLDYVLMDINTLAYNNREACAEGVRGYLDALQRSIIEQQERVDEIMIATPAAARSEVANTLFAQITEESYAKCKTMLDELRAYVKAGDTASKFVPSDYDSATGGLRTPLVYAGAVVEPVIVNHPASVACERGAHVDDLAVVATANDGVAGTDALLSYEWQRKDAATGEYQAIADATSATLPVDTTAVGTTTYRVKVTNAAGLSVLSNESTVTVKQPAAGQPQQPQPPAGQPEQKPAKKPTPGKLAQTGDAASFAVAGLGMAGLVGLAIGTRVRRRS